MATNTSEKSLVVYYSLSGNTARVAQEIATIAGADIEVLRDFDREPPLRFFGYLKAAIDALRGKAGRIAAVACDPRHYSLVVIGTPVWAGHMTPAVRAYLERFKGDLARVAFFVTSHNTEAFKIVVPMETIVGHKAEASVGFDAAVLRDQRACKDKIAEFLGAIRPAPYASESTVPVGVYPARQPEERPRL